MLLTNGILRSARGLVDWSATDLAKRSSVSIDTIRSFESGRTKSLTATNQEAIRVAFVEAGVQFLESGDVATGPGVALKAAD